MWIVKASYRLIVFGAKSPHVAALAKILWARGVEIKANLKIYGLKWGGAHRRKAVGVIPSAGAIPPL